jgi:hypothetical protein
MSGAIWNAHGKTFGFRVLLVIWGGKIFKIPLASPGGAFYSARSFC